MRAVVIGTAVEWVIAGALVALIVLLRRASPGFEGSTSELAMVIVVAVAANVLSGAVAASCAVPRDRDTAILAGLLAGLVLGCTTILSAPLTRSVLAVHGFHAPRLSDLPGSAASGAALGLVGAVMWHSLRTRVPKRPVT